MAFSGKPIKGYENYLINELGQIYSTLTNKFLRPSPGKPIPYLIVVLRKDGKSHPKYLHRLVAETFIDNPDNLPQVAHIDGNPANCEVSNLCWCTAAENAQMADHCQRLSESRQKYFENPVYHKDEVVVLYRDDMVTTRIFPNIKEAGKYIAAESGCTVNSAATMLSYILNSERGTQTCHGWRARYEKKEDGVLFW